MVQSGGDDLVILGYVQFVQEMLSHKHDLSAEYRVSTYLCSSLNVQLLVPSEYRKALVVSRWQQLIQDTHLFLCFAKTIPSFPRLDLCPSLAFHACMTDLLDHVLPLFFASD